MKKVIIILLAILLLTSCHVRKTKPTVDADADPLVYIERLKNYEVRKKNPNATTDDKKFDEFLDRFFVESFEDSYLHMHFNMTDYHKMGIEKPPVDLGEVEYALDKESFDYFNGVLDELAGFDFDKLSYRQQIDYENIEYSCLETLADLCYYRFNFIMSSGSNAPEDIITEFTDFTFYDKETVDDYITLLKDVTRYLNDVLTYTEKQAKDGYPMIDDWIDYTQEFCNRFTTESENNELILSFDKRLAELDFLSDSEREEYSKENRRIVLDEILPLYRKIPEEVEKYRGKAKSEDYVLCKLDKNYAELEYILSASSNLSIDEQFAIVEDAFSMLQAEAVSVYYDTDLTAQLEAITESREGIFGLSPKDMLEHLRHNTGAFFKDLGDVDYTVDYINADTASEGAVAYYWHAPVDNLDQNIIRVNPNSNREGYSIYATLAHEGFPGHLYQNIYFYKTNPHLYRTALGYIGYSEGWAVYTTYYALQSLDLNEYVSACLFYLDNYYFFEYALVDMAVNYYGWSTNDLYKYFKDNSILSYSKAYLESIRNWVIQIPGVYCSYGTGASMMFMLRDKAIKALGNKFDFPEFHELLIKNGPLPFSQLEAIVDQYIADNQ